MFTIAELTLIGAASLGAIVTIVSISSSIKRFIGEITSAEHFDVRPPWIRASAILVSNIGMALFLYAAVIFALNEFLKRF